MALALGWPDVDALEDSITAAQHAAWMAFFRHEPWGAEVEWYRTGTIAAMIANTAPNRRAGAPMVKPGDFVPRFAPPPKALDPAKTRLALRAIFGDGIKPPAGQRKGGTDARDD